MVTRRERQREATRIEIKTTARQQMALKGTAGLTLRGIAEEMGLTVTALYRYYTSLDDLITALIVDGFDAHADAMQAAMDQHLPTAYGERMLALMLAYRQWALDNRAVFQLIYGNPIPGYHAPAEVTMPHAKRGLDIMIPMLMPLQQAGRLRLPPGADLSVIASALAQYPGLDPLVLYVILVGRLRMHGLLMLEMHGHTEGTVLDHDAFYRHECLAVLRSMGIESTGSP
jgi:AcrR family transcriptional regulator